MKTIRILIALALFIAPFAVVCAQQPTADDPMMKKMMEFATPGPEHESLKNLVGTWDAEIKQYFGPEPTITKATSTYEMIADGRYLQEHATGNFQGMEFHGYGTTGYDNLQKKYVGTWIDNMGTGIMTMTGTSSDGGKTINWEGSGSDPIAGKVQNYKTSMKMITKDQYHFEMFGPGPDGKNMKVMEVTYNRRK
jgi:hypothetical protein